MPFARAGGLTVHYDITGPQAGPPVVLLNSLGTNFHLWDAQVPVLAERHRVVRYDMRGHGLSGNPAEREYTIAQLADDLAGLLDGLAIARAALVGLSIGGVVAQRFAAAYPARTERLVLCATGNRIGTAELWNERMETAERDGIAALAEGTLSRWFTPAMHAARPLEVDGFRLMLTRTPVAGYVGCCAALRDADLAADDARIVAPTLVIAGADDPSTPPATCAVLADAIPGARMQVINGAAHILNVERPGEFNRMLGMFLRASAAAGQA